MANTHSCLNSSIASLATAICTTLKMLPIDLQRLRRQDLGMYEHAYDERDMALYALGVGGVLTLFGTRLNLTTAMWHCMCWESAPCC